MTAGAGRLTENGASWPRFLFGHDLVSRAFFEMIAIFLEKLTIQTVIARRLFQKVFDVETYKLLLSAYRTEIKSGSFRGVLLRILVFAPLAACLFVLFEVALPEALRTLVTVVTAGYAAAVSPFLWFFNGDAPFSGGNDDGSSHFHFGFGSSHDDWDRRDDACHTSSDFSGGDSCDSSD